MEIRLLPKIAPGLRWLYPHLSYALPITNSNGSGLRPVANGDGVSTVADGKRRMLRPETFNADY